MIKKIRFFLLAFILLSALAFAAMPPNMIGTWTGSAAFVSVQDGYGSVDITLIVADQTGSLFRGTFVAIISGVPTSTIPFTGYVSAKKEVILTLGDDPDNNEPSLITVTAKLTGAWIKGYFQDSHDCGMGYLAVRR